MLDQLLQSLFHRLSSAQGIPNTMGCIIHNVPIFEVQSEMSKISLLFWISKSAKRR